MTKSKSEQNITVKTQEPKTAKQVDPNALAKVLEKLTKIKQLARPQKKSTLKNSIKSVFYPNKIDDREIEAIIDRLIKDGKICIVGSKIQYCF